MTYIIPNTFPNSWIKNKTVDVWPVLPSWPSAPCPNYPPTTTVITKTVVVDNNSPAVSLGNAFKPKKAGKTKSHIVFVLDDSSSMQTCRDSTVAGFNEFLQAQKTDAEHTAIETFVSLYKFDGYNVKCTVNRVNVHHVEPLNRNTYNPRGGTNLLDAIGGVLMKVNEQLSAKAKRERESVIIVVLTDGHENSSRTFTNTDIKAMVKRAEAKNWGFMFLGANIDAFSVGSVLGFGVNNTIQYNTSAMENTMRSASHMTSRMKSSYAAGMDTSATYATVGFSDQERSAAVDQNDK